MCQGDISAGGVQTGKCQLKWYYVTKIRNVILGEYDMINNYDVSPKFSGARLFYCLRGGLCKEFNIERRRLDWKADPLHSATPPSSTQESWPVSGTSNLINSLTRNSRETVL